MMFPGWSGGTFKISTDLSVLVLGQKGDVIDTIHVPL